LAAIRQAGRASADGDPAAEIHAAIAPQRRDIVVTVRRVRAFAGSALELALRAQGTDSLALNGIAMSMI
jgi:nicotinamidase-related amidase